MTELSFEKMPHYIFSANRQFEEGEHHCNRLFEFDVLILMRKGVLRFMENDVSIELGAGEYYIQRARMPQQGVLPSETPNYYFVHFKGHYNRGSGLPIRGTFNIDKIQEIILEIEACGTKAEKLEYERLFYTLLCQLKKDNSPKHNSAENIRAYLLEHYQQNISLDELSRLFYYSPNQIINMFKEKYRETPHQMIMKYRLHRAGELILATDAPITKISRDVGFADYTSFYKAFVNKFGISPQEYRTVHSTDILPENVYFYDPDSKKWIKNTP